MVVRGGHPRHERRSGRQVPFADVEQDEDRLLGQEAEAADRLLVVGIEAQVADRRAGLEAGVDAPDDDLLALGGLALGRGAVAGARLEPLEAALGHGQVGEHELEVEPLDVAGGVDAAVRVRVGRVLERADDVEQGVRIAQPGEVVGGQLLGPDVALGRRRRGRQVDVRDVGLDDLLGLEDAGQRVEPRVGHLDHADVEGDPAVAAGLGVAAGQRVEDGGLARSGKPDDGDLHRAIVAAGQYPALGSTTLSSGSPVAKRRRLSQNSSTLGRGRARSTRPCAA